MIRKVTVNHVNGDCTDFSSATIEISRNRKREKTYVSGKQSRKCMEYCRTYLETGFKPVGEFSIHLQDDECPVMFSEGDTSGYFSFQSPSEETNANGWRLRK